MGRRFALELSELSQTYMWARTVSLDRLIAFLRASAEHPLLAVGSGGSFSVANLAVELHQTFTGCVSKAVTPLEALSSMLNVRSLSVIILSAGGTNADILTAFKEFVSREPHRLAVLCLDSGSPLSRLAAAYSFVDLLNFSPPIPHDGFLATNSLLGSSILWTRGYWEAFGSGDVLPEELESLLSPEPSITDPIPHIRAASAALWPRDTTVVLYGPSLKAAAVDFESKFSEAALGNVQLADFRNFGHGRHNWLAKHGDRTGVLALHTVDERMLADRTLSLIPKSIPITRVEVPYLGPAANLGGFVAVLHLVAAAGEHRGIDPGRPGVPRFGRRLYSLQPQLHSFRRPRSASDIAIARKLHIYEANTSQALEKTIWQEAYTCFTQRLSEARFGAIVLDYDGTLCGESNRFAGLDSEVAEHLNGIAEHNILIGIATGRGKSVREALKRVVPSRLWSQFWLGCYNGAEIACLADMDCPDLTVETSGPLHEIASVICKHPIISNFAKSEVRRTQISFIPRQPSSIDRIWDILQATAGSYGLRAVRSGHSVDLLLPNVSKEALCRHLQDKVGPNLSVLRIGDRGGFSGNDHALLSSGYSLSVDEVSTALDSCWNLAPPGCRGVQATVWYLQGIVTQKGQFTIGSRYLRRIVKRMPKL